MQNTISYTILSVIIISLISFIGALTFLLNKKNLKRPLIYLISFSAGALFGDAFLHLLPEVSEEGLSLNSSILILSGLIMFFILEKFIHWQHCHAHFEKESHVHSFAYMDLIGDALHNFIDGLIIVAGYLINIPIGIATTIAVALHEIPQEIGDLSILLHGGFKKTTALLLNFASALFAVIGAVIALLLSNKFSLEPILIPIAIGGFIYIAGSDLIPELHKHSDKLSKSFLQLLMFIIGIIVMALLLLIE